MYKEMGSCYFFVNLLAFHKKKKKVYEKSVLPKNDC